MAHEKIRYNGRELKLKKAIKNPKFESNNVIVSNHFEYVDMWLQKNAPKGSKQKYEKARIYWNQSHEFYKISRKLGKISSPLPIYYSILNAAKALLEIRSIKSYSPYHGLTGKDTGRKTSLENEIVILKGKGVLPSLIEYYDFGIPTIRQYNLKQLLYNLPFVHRAYGHTYKNQTDLFIPISKPFFLKSAANKEAWVSFAIDKKMMNGFDKKKIPKGFEFDLSTDYKNHIRLKKRFRSSRILKKSEFNSFTNYFCKVRKQFVYIASNEPLWYLKRTGITRSIDNLPSPVIIFMIAHRLSELSRYSPDLLHSHYKSGHNWLLVEFLNNCLDQFIDQVCCDICGQDLHPPSSRPK
jgi:hypothetical protein